MTDVTRKVSCATQPRPDEELLHEKVTAPPLVAQVVVDVQTRALDGCFDYLVPELYLHRITPGWRVYVPFGNQFRQGYVLSVGSSSDNASPLKPILSLLGKEPILSSELIELVLWMHDRYVCTYLEAILAMIPGALRVRKVHQVAARAEPTSEASQEQHRVWAALASRPRSLNQLVKQFGTGVLLDLEQMKWRGWVEEVESFKEETSAKLVHLLEAVASKVTLTKAKQEKSKRAPKQARILEQLLVSEQLVLEEHQLRPSDEAIRALVQVGLARLVEREVYRAPDDVAVTMESTDRTLTSFQNKALKTILAARDNEEDSVVLFGVTGSGKTEVYLRAIADTLLQGGGAIVLVPEISLTSQMVGRFRQAFGTVVAVLHSGLSDGEKRDEWLRIRRGEAKIAVGARSAVFAPVENLQLLIVDEEHEPSYKQEEGPHYDAREIARWRAHKAHGVVVYGSATPSLGAMVDVERGRSRLASLPFRVHGRPLPPVEIVDMREELRSGNRRLFSRALTTGLEQSIHSGHQAILFLNRRGYASFLLCRNCGETLTCPNCDISLTLHKGRSKDYLECHYCGFHSGVPGVCPSCKDDALRPFGIGTQQVEQFLQQGWPDWRVLRMDVDTTRQKGAHQHVIQSFLNEEADILLGTQMVAKGLDFPNVAFVGVVAADTMLSVPDYRAAERTFNLLTQVSGRSGRADVEGSTVIQTYQPEHYSIATAAMHDYHGFFTRERELRQAFTYPPFCELAVFLATHPTEEYARGAAMRFEREVKRSLSEDQCTVLPAVPSGVKRVENRFRYQVVVKYKEWSDVQATVAQAYHLVAGKMRKLRGTCTLDVNAGRI